MIREVQLTNFMSYKNASVPLEPGLNLIVGPNGAGKSSILLAISVVLGQAYTERAKRLSELIRWGEKESRISLILDNISPKGTRPFPQARSETVLLTRVLKRNGDYLYLLNNKPISKADLVDGLVRIGLNPDNMLVIMHQLMVGKFGSVSPPEKLLLLEDAIGFGAYRREVIDSTARLQKLTTEREAMSSVLEGTKETYQHWQREYEKYEFKRKLEQQLKDLQRELLWRRILRKEAGQAKVRERISRVQLEMDRAKKDLDASEIDGRNIATENSELDKQIDTVRQEQLKLEFSRGLRTGTFQWIEKLSEILEEQERLIGLTQDKDSGLYEALRKESDEIKNSLLDIQRQQQEFSAQLDAEESEQRAVRLKIQEVTSLHTKNVEKMVQFRVQHEVSAFKLASLSDQLEDLELQAKLAREELEPLHVQAAQLGPSFDNPRDLQTITLELASVQERLRPLAHLSDEVERMYRNYGELYEDLKNKATVVEQNRSEVLDELRQRFDRWKTVMGHFLEELSKAYDSLLSQVEGKGRILLKASKDIDKAGLDLLAGFKGNEPVSLDGLTPSGGERTVSLVAFLLCLQQFISSPFRAIDEFDVHMDPRNRETVSKLIYAVAQAKDSSQYVAITPGQLSLPSEDNLHVIVVQNVEGTSMVRELTDS